MAGTWRDVSVTARLESPAVARAGEPVVVSAEVTAPGWSPGELAVEVVYGRAADELRHGLRVVPMRAAPGGGGAISYRAQFVPELSGRLAYGVRARPVNDLLAHPQDAHAVTWAG